jgi:hypothetical protein
MLNTRKDFVNTWPLTASTQQIYGHSEVKSGSFFEKVYKEYQ